MLTYHAQATLLALKRLAECFTLCIATMHVIIFNQKCFDKATSCNVHGVPAVSLPVSFITCM